MSEKMPIHYRYDDYAYKEGVEVNLSKFYPIRETKCFYFVINEFDKTLLKICPNRKTRIRKVSKDGLRRYCYPSKEQALHSFKKRKEHQIWHNEFSLAKAKQCLSYLDKVEGTVDKYECGRPDHWDNINFD